MSIPRLGRRVRRMGDDARVELTPMIDVVFLLLTFFVFSIVLMIRADVLDVQLPELTAGENAERVTPITIAIDAQGSVFVNSEQIAQDQIIPAVSALRDESPGSPILLAVDVRSDAGVLIELADALVGAEMGDFSIVGREATPDQPTESEPQQGDQP